MVREIQLHEWGVIIGVLALVLGGSALLIGVAAPTDHARVTVTSTGVLEPVDTQAVTPYSELRDSSQAVFRDAVRQNEFVETAMSDVTGLRGVTAVSLDGDVYAVRMSENEKPMSFGAFAVAGIFAVITGFALVARSLQRVSVTARDVFVGVSSVALAVGIILSGMYVFTPGMDSQRVTVSTSPVEVASSSGDSVVPATVLTPGEREALYGVVEGGEAVPAAQARYVPVTELQRVAASITYVQTNSEYYKVRSTQPQPGWRDIGAFALFMSMGAVFAMSGARLTWNAYNGRAGNTK